MEWVIIGLSVATAISAATVIVAMFWERRRHMLALAQLREQKRQQEIARYDAERKAELERKMADIKWLKIAR